MSCRSMKDLELEEVKGFMDLGFIFKKEHLNKRMISVVPGLLRLGFGFSKTKQIIKTDDHKPIINLDSSNSADDDHDHDNEIDKEDDDHHDDFEQEKRGVTVMRPYLSEAWLIKRPDSPLLNLRVPKLSAAADMKKHLKNWAKTVASEIQQAC
ncbi:hypothetical protein COLO4_27056 [Corchorus olitorius]|uniref:Uncharacterized protein n=1 Tax=Corchorus olitorius TaxID=93759 RepID=A0A1R3HT66_9ROSI|nr:hypothetical protein COLO4_27056 [Corchorus olitorius]